MRKIFIMSKMVVNEPIVLKFCLNLFLRFFWNYTRWQESGKVTVFYFYGKILISPKMGKGSFFGPKSNLFNVFLSLFMRFSWYCTWWQAWEIGFKVTVLEFGHFWGLKLALIHFSPNMVIRFFWNYTWWQTLTSGQKWLLWIFK